MEIKIKQAAPEVCFARGFPHRPPGRRGPVVRSRPDTQDREVIRIGWYGLANTPRVSRIPGCWGQELPEYEEGIFTEGSGGSIGIATFRKCTKARRCRSRLWKRSCD
jgi:hypothetical protein